VISLEKSDILTTVSLCMIVKNDEAVIERCLKSVADLVDEIIVVDLESTDRTNELALTFTNNIYTFGSNHKEIEAISYSFQLTSINAFVYL
jgi:glycosyltransferase involved in cell wall biosynthesis